MPFIDSKITVPVTSELKEEIKSELGKLITTLGKTETYLMVGIEDAYDLWLGGKKLDKGAYVSVRLLGSASKPACQMSTKNICDILSSELGLDGSKIYVTYHPVDLWGWNGSMF